MVKSGDHKRQKTRLSIGPASLHTLFLRAAVPRADNLTAVVLHGAGEAHSGRHEYLAEAFVDAGISVVSLDFVGHGKTGGNVSDNSLRLRTEHARAAIEHWAGGTAPLILCGFSMSGHTVLRLLPQLGERVKGIGLFCPAIYAAEAEDVYFCPRFTEILRTPESWRSSPGLLAAVKFRGRAAIVVGSEDRVIPWEVIMELTGSFKQNAQAVRLEVLGGAEHKLADWLSRHQEFSADLVRYLAKL